LTHSQEIKATIDRAWGVVHHKHKKEKDIVAAGGSTAADLDRDREFLGLLPYGYDAKRTRYWVIDRACFSMHAWRSSCRNFPPCFMFKMGSFSGANQKRLFNVRFATDLYDQ
jgi:hypothetical protein